MHMLIHIIERAVLYDVVFKVMRYLTLPEAIGVGCVVAAFMIFGHTAWRGRSSRY
jgi:hypothetical protein